MTHREEIDEARRKLIASGWEPKWVLDLTNATTKSLSALLEQIETASKETPPEGPAPWKNGWHLFTQKDAEEALLRNVKNRKVSLATVVYYAEQMLQDKWPKTGQPLIFDENGKLVDGQHRDLACYLSGVPFWTYVVSDVPARPDLFAYIDNVKARTPAHALQTAGLNGASALIAQVLKIAEEYEGGHYTGTQVTRHPRLAPVQYLEAVENHPNAHRAARLTNSDYEDAVRILGAHKDVVGFVAMKIIDLFGQPTADLFFDDLIGTTEGQTGDPIWALRKLMADDAKKQKPMKRHIALANVILAFNAWKQGEPVKKRWFMASHEDFPRFVEPEAEEDHSEAEPEVEQAEAAE